MEGSKKYSLNASDLKGIGKGAVVAMGGAGITYLATVVGQVDFGEMTPMVVALSGILVNVLRKWLKDYSN